MIDQKKRWIDETLKSLDGIKQVEPNPELWGKIKRATLNKSIGYISQKKVWAAAASFLFLIFLNGLIIKSNDSTVGDQRSATLTIIEQYQLSPIEITTENIK